MVKYSYLRKIMKIEYNQEDVRQRVMEIIDAGKYKTTREFATSVGIDCSNLYKMLKGQQNFTKATMMVICEATGVNLQWLAYGKGESQIQCDANLDDVTLLRIEKARLEERVQCLENEKAFLQRMLEK